MLRLHLGRRRGEGPEKRGRRRSHLAASARSAAAADLGRADAGEAARCLLRLGYTQAALRLDAGYTSRCTSRYRLHFV